MNALERIYGGLASSGLFWFGGGSLAESKRHRINFMLRQSCQHQRQPRSHGSPVALGEILVQAVEQFNAAIGAGVGSVLHSVTILVHFGLPIVLCILFRLVHPTKSVRSAYI